MFKKRVFVVIFAIMLLLLTADGDTLTLNSLEFNVSYNYIAVR